MRTLFIFGLATIFLLTACQPGTPQKPGTLRIVTTTGMLKDALTAIGGSNTEVEGLMGPGVDPHLYKATPADLQRLREADVVMYHGLHLEGKMAEVMQKLGRTKTVVAVAESIPEAQLIEVADGQYDPHIWFDVSLWAQALEFAASELARIDPDHAAAYRQNYADYRARLDSLHARTKAQLATVPAENRVLITAHDAFAYFGRAYEVEVRGLQGISTVAEYGLRDVSDLVKFISQRKIKAVFVESSVPPKSLEAVVEGCKQAGHDVRIGGSLYSDAMGQAGTPEGTYIGMVNANVSAIVNALK